MKLFVLSSVGLALFCATASSTPTHEPIPTVSSVPRTSFRPTPSPASDVPTPDPVATDEQTDDELADELYDWVSDEVTDGSFDDEPTFEDEPADDEPVVTYEPTTDKPTDPSNGIGFDEPVVIDERTDDPTSPPMEEPTKYNWLIDLMKQILG